MRFSAAMTAWRQLSNTSSATVKTCSSAIIIRGKMTALNPLNFKNLTSHCSKEPVEFVMSKINLHCQSKSCYFLGFGDDFVSWIGVDEWYLERCNTYQHFLPPCVFRARTLFPRGLAFQFISILYWQPWESPYRKKEIPHCFLHPTHNDLSLPNPQNHCFPGCSCRRLLV